MRNFGLLCAAALVALSLAARAATPTDAGSTATPHYGSWGFDLKGQDTAIKPGDDFYAYANGTYLKTTDIPADRVRFGNFDALSVLSENRVHAILEEAAAHPGASAADRKVGAYYTAFMDEARVEQLGVRPLQDDLDRIRAAGSRADLAEIMGATTTRFGGSLFSLRISPDAKDPGRYAVYVGQSGLGLPDRDYYLKPELAAKKAAYQAYVAQMLHLIGWPDADARARGILDFETKVAGASWTRAERRDRDRTYNPMRLAELAQAAPGFDFQRLLKGADLEEVQRVVVSENTAAPLIANVSAATPLETLKAWEAFNVADQAAPFLPRAFVEARYAFRDRTLKGQPELQARWKRAVAAEDGALGEAVGRVYVARYFTPEAKAQMEQLVSNLKDAFHARIERLTWMTPETKAQALTKLAAFSVKIGYPAQWKSYDFEVSPTDLYGDEERAQAWAWRYRLERLHQPVDRAEWGMTPQTVNAYYNSTLNEIVFPPPSCSRPSSTPTPIRRSTMAASAG